MSDQRNQSIEALIRATLELCTALRDLADSLQESQRQREHLDVIDASASEWAEDAVDCTEEDEWN